MRLEQEGFVLRLAPDYRSSRAMSYVSKGWKAVPLLRSAESHPWHNDPPRRMPRMGHPHLNRHGMHLAEKRSLAGDYDIPSGDPWRAKLVRRQGVVAGRESLLKMAVELKRLRNRSIVEPLRDLAATGFREPCPRICVFHQEVASQH
jgi:hypothetical protein